LIFIVEDRMRKLPRTLSSFYSCLGVVTIPNGRLFAQDSSSAITGGIRGAVPPCPDADPVPYPEHMLSPKYPRKARASGFEGSVELSALIGAPNPEFSEKARLAKEQGSVNLEVIVGNDGQPRRVRLACSSVPDLNENAIDTVKTWRFDPGTIGGRPVSVEIHIEVGFNLHINLY
jgi:TonB family protein